LNTIERPTDQLITMKFISAALVSLSIALAAMNVVGAPSPASPDTEDASFYLWPVCAPLRQVNSQMKLTFTTAQSRHRGHFFLSLAGNVAVYFE
jgi:hypothetical protein